MLRDFILNSFRIFKSLICECSTAAGIDTWHDKDCFTVSCDKAT
jgi:hypothetical protein